MTLEFFESIISQLLYFCGAKTRGVCVGISGAMANSDNEQSFLEGVINYVDPMGFLGGKERIRIPIDSKHSSLEVLKRHIIENTGLKAEFEKRGLGYPIEIKLC